jgi:hypothetical protein
MIHLTRKPVELPAFRLATPVDMFDALSELNSQGWRGQISANESGSYYLEANADAPTRQITAHIGDVLVDDLGWRLLTAGQADAGYDEVTP